jgi:hypothetical protein
MFLSSRASRPVLGSFKPPIWWLPRASPREKKKRGRGLKLAAHLHLMQVKREGAIITLSHASSLHGALSTAEFM